MRPTSDIVFGVTGQSLLGRAIEGRPSSATFEVFHDYAGDYATPLFDGTATIDSVSTTVSSSSGAGQADAHRINLTSTSGIVRGRKYLLSEGQRQEWVVPVEIGVSYIRARHVLRNACTTAATFVGTTMSAAVDATFVATESYLSDLLDPNPDYRVRWEYVVDGATYVSYTFFDLVRGTVTPQVDISDVNDAAPGLNDTMPSEYKVEQGRPLIERAWRRLQADLGAIQVDTDALRDNQLLDELVIAKALVVLAMGGWRPAAFDSIAAYYTIVRDDYDRLLEKNFYVSNSRRLAAGTSGGAERVEVSPIAAK